jgi:oxygen-dependent protoporphyrinogen oxidase
LKTDLEGRDVVVVGAGPAGLAAALALRDRGATVVVLDREARAGGRSRTEPIGEWRFDSGAEFLASFYERTLALIRRLDLDRELVTMPVAATVVLRDGARAVLPATPFELMRTPLLSRRSKRRLVLLGLDLLRWRRVLRWRALERAAFLDEHSAAQWFEKRIGRDYVENVLRPTLESLVLSPVEETSCVVPLAQANEARGARLLCPVGGLGELWAEVGRRVQFRGPHAVAEVRSAKEGVRVRLESGVAIQAHAAVVAVPGPTAARLVDDAVPEKGVAAAARYSPVVKLHLCLDEPVPEARPLCPAGPGRNALAGIGILEAKKTGQVPEGRGGLNVCASPALAAHLLDETDEVVRTRLWGEAEALLGWRLPPVSGEAIVRMREGVPLFHVGWLKRLEELRWRLRPSSIALAGDYLASPSIEGAVRSGEEAADRVANWLLGH